MLRDMHEALGAGPLPAILLDWPETSPPYRQYIAVHC